MSCVSFVSNGVSVSLIVQGDTPKQWYPAQQWQIDFLRPLAYDSQILNVSTKTTNKHQEYVAFALNFEMLPENACFVFEKFSHDERKIFEDLLYKFNQQLSKENKSQLYNIGFLVNIKTRKIRLFAFMASSLANDLFLSSKTLD